MLPSFRFTHAPSVPWVCEGAPVGVERAANRLSRSVLVLPRLLGTISFALGCAVSGEEASMFTRVFLLSLTVASVAVPQGTPANWKVLKDLEDACQISVPGDWDTNLPAIAQSPGNKAMAVIKFDENDRYAPLDAAALKALDTVKVVENSAKRYFVQSKEFPGITSTAAPSRRWMVAIPAPKGQCSVMITLVQGADEATAVTLANSLAPLKP